MARSRLRSVAAKKMSFSVARLMGSRLSPETEFTGLRGLRAMRKVFGQCTDGRPVGFSEEVTMSSKLVGYYFARRILMQKLPKRLQASLLASVLAVTVAAPAWGQ